MMIDLTGDYGTTIYTAARRLLAEGANPHERLETWRNGKLSMSGTLSKCAKWAVSEPSSGNLHLARWKPFPHITVAGVTALPGMPGTLTPPSP